MVEVVAFGVFILGDLVAYGVECGFGDEVMQ